VACGNTISPDDARAAAASAAPPAPPGRARELGRATSSYVRDGRVDYAAAANAASRSGAIAQAELAEALLDAFTSRYCEAAGANGDVVQVDLDSASYLFDVVNERIVGVVGTSSPTPAATRDTARQAGSPSPNRPGETGRHRGHALAHTIGGGLDMNLFDQAASVNLSRAWREYESYAQENPGTFVAVSMLYTDAGQRPSGLEYGIVRDGQFEHRAFDNG
jgi:hypothetical protein